MGYIRVKLLKGILEMWGKFIFIFKDLKSLFLIFYLFWFVNELRVRVVLGGKLDFGG